MLNVQESNRGGHGAFGNGHAPEAECGQAHNVRTDDVAIGQPRQSQNAESSPWICGLTPWSSTMIMSKWKTASSVSYGIRRERAMAGAKEKGSHGGKGKPAGAVTLKGTSRGRC